MASTSAAGSWRWGKFEALNSLAGLAADQPRLDHARDRALVRSPAAVKIGHPLLPTSACVPKRRDARVRRARSCSFPVPICLARALCCERSASTWRWLRRAARCVPSVLRCRRLRWLPACGWRDSLEAGVSFYMAELMRLKEIVDLARNRSVLKDRKLLYLLDEILLGTNSRSGILQWCGCCSIFWIAGRSARFDARSRVGHERGVVETLPVRPLLRKRCTIWTPSVR